MLVLVMVELTGLLDAVVVVRVGVEVVVAVVVLGAPDVVDVVAELDVV